MSMASSLWTVSLRSAVASTALASETSSGVTTDGSGSPTSPATPVVVPRSPAMSARTDGGGRETGTVNAEAALAAATRAVALCRFRAKKASQRVRQQTPGEGAGGKGHFPLRMIIAKSRTRCHGRFVHAES